MTERPAERAFVAADGRPVLARCALLFLDFLGVREMTRGPQPVVEQQLVALHAAFTRTYRNYLSPHSAWPAAFFSDTLVLAAPVEQDDEAAAVEGLILQAAQLQVDLYRAGFFARGGITLGLVHMREGLLFGPALVEAYGALATTPPAQPQPVVARHPLTAPLVVERDDMTWRFTRF